MKGAQGIIQFKNILGGAVKDIDTKNKVVTGYLSKFGNEDSDQDIIHAGSFQKSIKERRPRILFLNQHKWDQPHGGFEVLKEDGYGLYFESKPLTDTTYSSDAIKLYQAGILKEHSIGFRIVKDEYDRESDIRNIKEVMLYEGSNVTLGANPETPFMGFKSFTIEEANDQISKIIKMLRTGTLSDEGFAQIEIALKTLQLQSVELGKTLKTEKPGKPTTPKGDEPLINTINEYIKSI